MTMTAPAVPQHAELWRTMPGWGITANLLPPEIVSARRARVLRKIVIFVLVGLLLIGAAAYGYAYKQNSDAGSDLAAAQSQTAQLHLEQHKYGEVVQITGDVAQVASRLSTLLATDVDFPKLLGELVDKAPRGGSITQLGVTMQGGPTVSGQTTTTTQPSVVLDPTGRTPVGMVTITGTARSMPDVAAYVNALARVPGVVAVYPSSQQFDGTTLTYSLGLTLTDQVYSHRFDSTSTVPTGGN
jgi:hypothetical protein